MNKKWVTNSKGVPPPLLVSVIRVLRQIVSHRCQSAFNETGQSIKLSGVPTQFLDKRLKLIFGRDK